MSFLDVLRLESVIVESQSILAAWWITSDWQLCNMEPVIRNMIYFTTKLASLFFDETVIEDPGKEIFTEIPLVKFISETNLNIQHWIPIIWIIIDILKSTISFNQGLFRLFRHFSNLGSIWKILRLYFFSAWCCKKYHIIRYYDIRVLCRRGLSCQLLLMYAAQYATLNVSIPVLMICE